MTPSRRRRELDETDIRIRPNPRGTRPRSKDRPLHSGAEAAWVIAVDRGRYSCLMQGPASNGEGHARSPP